MLLRTIAFLIAARLSFAVTAAEPPKLRLPGTVAPVRYAADLTVVPDRDNFQGEIHIDIDVRRPESLIWLNATGLTVYEAAFEHGSSKLSASVVPGGDNFVGLSFSESVSGPGTLHIRYQGKISRNSSAGVFEMREDGRWYVYTQFEPTDARRAFPCFDEPNYKVPWQLTLRVPRDQLAVSNTPEISEDTGSTGLKTVRFAATKPLPSYLVAFAVGPFDVVDGGKLGSTPLRIIVPRGHAKEAKFASEAFSPLLKLLEKYFGSPYPYEKLDSIAMPISNFAMENAGLITYGQELLLSDPANDSFMRQRDCAITMAHEMAHQWVGDLVTTAWWDDIWLNEAFAEWMEKKIVAEWKPRWNIPVEAVYARLGAMGADSLVSARQVRQPILSNNDIANAFDSITYDKGAAVLSTFEHWIGAETFRKGVRDYLKEHAYGNATTADFEAAISKAYGRDVAPAFDSFLNQPGVPVITANLECQGKNSRLQLTQARSLPLGSSGSRAEVWQIPFCVRYGREGETHSACELLPATAHAAMDLHGGSCPEWVLGNDGELGYYRVNYVDGLLNGLLAGNRHELTLAETVGVLGDTHALMNAGDVSPKTLLGVVPQFASDPRRDVVQAALDIAGVVESPIMPQELEPRAEAFIRSVFGARADSIGWEPKSGEGETQRLLRETLVPAVAAEGRDRKLIDEAERLAHRWFENHNALTSGLLPEVLDVAAQFGDRDLFNRMVTAAKNEKDQRTREELLRAIGSFRDPAIAKDALDLLLTGGFDPREAFDALLFGPAAYPETRELPFEFVKQNLDALLAKLPREVGSDFAAQLPDVGGYFCSEREREELREFFEERVKQYNGGPRTLAATLERINLCIARKQAIEPEIAAFLNERAD